jgi:hypothetical protein
MKFLMTTAALAMLAASPAFAASHAHMTQQPTVSEESANAYAYQMRDPATIVDEGQVVGRDPDPNIRFQVLRDHGLLAD